MPAAVSRRVVALIVLAYLISVIAYSALPEPRWPVTAPLAPGFGRLMTALDVWMRVNRFTGYIAVAFGAALVASAVVPPGRMARDLVSTAAVLAVVALATAYGRHSRPMRNAQTQVSGIGFMGWLLRAPVVVIFPYFGVMKFPNNPASPWPQLFAEIGFGQWFRYFTGMVEVAGAILLLIPRTSRIAATALACTMLGAILTHVFVVGVSPAILLPVTLLGILTLIIRSETARLRR